MEYDIIMEYDILSELNRIMEKLQEAVDVLVAHDKAALTDPNMEIAEWNQTPNGQVVGLIGDAIQMIDDLEV